VVAACKLNTDLDQPVAIEITLPDSGRVEIDDTLRPSGRALNGVGDSVAVQLIWSSLDSTLAVVDSLTGESVGVEFGTGRLQARAGNLFSNPQTVLVLARLDSVRALGDDRDTVVVTPPDTTQQPDSLSDSLRVETVAFGGAAANRRVVYTATIYPASGPVVTFVPNDSVVTNASGIAQVQLRLLAGGSVPDSVVVMAAMKRANGTPAPGSPVTFVVEFRP
jgi:hypothetical protein